MHKPTLRVIQVLDLLCKNRQSMRLAEISRELDVPKSTLLPILQTLVDHRYISKDGLEGYAPGFGLLGLGAAARSVFSASGYVRDNLESLVARFSETCYYGVLEGGSVLYLDKADSPQPIRMLTEIGHRLPAYATGIGKALLLEKSREQLDSLYPDELKPLTKNTLPDVQTLYMQLQQANALGYTWETEESTEHIRCFAVPVRVNGEITGAVSIAIPVFRYREEQKDAIIKALKETAQDISNGFCLF